MKALILAIFLVATTSLCSAQSSIEGLGKSTVTCVDKDGDGYGTGEGCLGPDANDNDAQVHSAAEAVAAYGSIPNTFATRGYNPSRYWIIDPVNGNNSTGKVCTPSTFSSCSPYLTWTAISGSVTAGDAVVFRAGTISTWAVTVKGGTTNNPIYYLSYPGETVTMSTPSARWSMLDTSWYVIDGFRTINNACMNSMGTNDAGINPTTSLSHDIVIRHLEATACGSGFWGMVGLVNVLIEEGSFHDNYNSHGMYLGTRGTLINEHVVVRRNLFYNNNYTGVQFNGRFHDSEMSQNIAYRNAISGFSWENGVNYSRFYSNLAFDNTNKQFNIATYDGTEGTVNCGPATGLNGARTLTCSCNPVNQAAICPWDNHHNTIANSTFYSSGYSATGLPNGSPLVWVGRMSTGATGCNTATCFATSQHDNTYQNLLLVMATAPSSHTPPFAFTIPEAAAPTGSSTSSFNGVMFYEAAHNYPGWLGLGQYVGGGYLAYDCSTAGAQVLASTNCANKNPQFAALGTWNNSGGYNFTLQPGSPAIHGGTPNTSLGVPPVYDLTGKAYAATPTVGAIEPSGTAAALTAISCTPTSVTTGSSASCTVALPGPAASGGAVVALSSSSTAITVPASVTVAAGASSASFSAVIGNGSSGQAVLVSASLNGTTVVSTLKFPAVVTLSGVTCSPGSVVSAGTMTCTVTLSQAATTGGSSVGLTSTLASLGVPSAVVVAAGSATAQFTATAGTVSTVQSGTITAQYSGASASAAVSVQPVVTSTGGGTSSAGAGTSLTPGTWTMVSTHGFPVQSVGYEKIVYAPAPVKKFVMLGNYHEMSSEPNTSLIAYDFQSNRWDVLDVGGLFHTENMPEAGHTVGGFSYDPNRKIFEYYCCASGSNQPENPYLTWWYDPIGQTGRNKQTSPKPGMVQYESSTFDTFNDVYVMHGGLSWEGTWTYSPSTNLFQQQKPLGTPPDPSVLQPAMAYDSDHHLSYLFGGQIGSAYSNDIYAYDAAANTWTKLNPAGSRPPARWRAALAYDSTNHVFMLYGGVNGATLYNDTWIYDPTANTWTQLTPAQNPPTPTSAVFERLAYDPDDNVFLLVAPGQGGYLDSTWTGYPIQTWMFRYQGAGPNPGTMLQTYTPTGNSINRRSNAWAKDPSIAVSGGALLSTWVETGGPSDIGAGAWFHVYGAQQSTTGWTAMGGLPTSLDSEFNNGTESHAPSIAVVGGKPWISWYKGNNAGALPALYAKSWNGTAWVGGAVGPVGTKVFQGPSQMADVAGTPHVAFLEVDKSYYPQKTFAYVKYWNGTSWALLGTGPLNLKASSMTVAGSISIASDGTNPYVAWTEYTMANAGSQAESNPQVYVAHWTGSQWVSVGSSLNVSAGTWADSATITFAGGRPYVAWTERTTAGNAQLFVKTFDGTNWVLVGGGPLNKDPNSGWAFHPSLAADAAGGQLYIGWVEQQALGQTSQTYVSVLSNGAWAPVGGSLNADQAGSAQRVSIVVAGGQPAAAWGEVKFGSLRQVFVKQWNGTAWTTPGAAKTTPSATISACDLNGDGAVDATDVQLAVNQVIGVAPCGNADLQQIGQCTVVGVQRIINAMSGGACVTGQ